MSVDEFVSLEMLKPFEPGQTDCATTADRWFETVRGFSALESYGRRVRDSAGMEQWLSEPGGLLRAIALVMRACGVRTTKFPKAGDIGIVIIGGRACVALYNGETWWSRDADGYIVTNDTFRFKAWDVA